MLIYLFLFLFLLYYFNSFCQKRNIIDIYYLKKYNVINAQNYQNKTLGLLLGFDQEKTSPNGSFTVEACRPLN